MTKERNDSYVAAYEVNISSAEYFDMPKNEPQMHGEPFFSSCSREAWIMFPGLLLHRATLIICAYHVTRVGPITMAYFRVIWQINISIRQMALLLWKGC